MTVGGLNESGERDLALHIVCLSIAVIATVLRMWCKAVTLRSAFRSFHADDWLLVATTVSYLGAAVASLWGLLDGNKGRELDEMMKELKVAPSLAGLREMENYLESLFVGNTVLYLTFYLAKLSICMLYRRIFSTEPFRRICLLLMGISTAWFITVQVTNLVICIPIDSFWHRTKPHRCLNFNLFSLIVGIAEIVLDTSILLLPVRAVLSLQMPLRNKIIVSGIFLVGSFSVITNMLRVSYQYQPNGFYVSFRQATIWANIHAAVTILCACLPVYKPLRDLVGKFVYSIRDRYASSSLRGLVVRSTTWRGGAGRNSKNSDGEGNGDSGYDLGTTRLDHDSSSAGNGGFYKSYVSYPSREVDSTKELVLGPGQVHYAVGARRGSDLSSGENFHHGGGGVGELPGGTGNITRTTKIEVV